MHVHVIPKIAKQSYEHAIKNYFKTETFIYSKNIANKWFEIIIFQTIQETILSSSYIFTPLNRMFFLKSKSKIIFKLMLFPVSLLLIVTSIFSIL